MLPQQRRIPRKDFPYLLSQGKRYNSSHILLYTAPLIGEKSLQSRFSFSISKKIASHAVDRNRYRRRGYSVVSKHITELKPGFLCFFSFKKGSFPLTFPILETEIIDLLKASRVL